MSSAQTRPSPRRRLMRAALVGAGVVLIALALGRLAAHGAPAAQHDPGLLAIAAGESDPGVPVRALIERARAAAMAYARADPRRPSDTLRRLRQVAKPRLLRRIAELLRQDAAPSGAAPAPRARVIRTRLVAVWARSARVLVVVERRQGVRVVRQVLEQTLDRRSGRVAGLASL